MSIIENESQAVMFDTIFVKRQNSKSWIRLNIQGIGKINHEFEIPPALLKALFDCAHAQARLKIADIQAFVIGEKHAEEK